MLDRLSTGRHPAGRACFGHSLATSTDHFRFKIGTAAVAQSRPAGDPHSGSTCLHFVRGLEAWAALDPTGEVAQIRIWGAGALTTCWAGLHPRRQTRLWLYSFASYKLHLHGTSLSLPGFCCPSLSRFLLVLGRQLAFGMGSGAGTPFFMPLGAGSSIHSMPQAGLRLGLPPRLH